MKKILTLTLILIFSVCSVFAVALQSTDTLTVAAYKKTKSENATYKLNVYDAIAANLASIGNNGEIDISNSVSKFVETDKTSYDSLALGKLAVFSVHIDGNTTGNFKLTITFNSFAKHTTSDNVETVHYDKVITTTYRLSDYTAVFSDTEASTSPEENPTYSIDKLDSTIDNKTVTDSTEIGKSGIMIKSDNNEDNNENVQKTAVFQWSVSDDNDSSSEGEVVSQWQVHLMAAMIIDESSYDKAENGFYKAPVALKLEMN